MSRICSEALDAVYVAYWSLRDPLCVSQSLPVVRALATHGWRLALVTYEQPPWTTTADDDTRAKAELAGQGILWMPLRYHKRPAILSTFYDVGAGVRCCLSLARRSGVRLLHTRASVPGAVGYLVSRLTGARFFYDADGPLSEEYVDAGLWRRGSLPHRLTGWMEDRCLASADIVAVLSEHRQNEIAGRRSETPVVVPCGVDTEHFRRDPAAGERARRDLGLEGTVFVYAGKSGGWYRTDAMLDFVRDAGGVLGRVSLLVLTTEPEERFTRPATERGLSVMVRRATRHEMPAYLSAGDVGLSFRLETPSQRAASPIKNGEYLACGLPVVTTPSAGDYGEIVERRRVGIVVDGVTSDRSRRAAVQLRDLLSEPELRARCRQAAVAEVGLREVVVPRYVEVYERLLGAVSAVR